MNHVNRIVKRIVSDHHTVIFIGVVLIVMGLISLSDNLIENLLGIKYRVAYGYLFLGIFNVVAAIAFIIMGAMNVEAGIDSENPLEKKIKQLEERVKHLEEKQVEA
jgi:hypothetical protein